MPPAGTGKNIQVLIEWVNTSRTEEKYTCLEASSNKVFGVVIICERGKHIMRQVRNAICQEDDGIEEGVHHHGQTGRRLLWINSHLRILQRGVKEHAI